MMVDIFVPLILQSSISAAALGLFPAGSVARLATTPVLCYFVYCVWSAADTHVRKQWASGFFFASANLMLHWMDIALLDRWTYHRYPGYSSKDMSESHTMPSILSRLKWACWALVQHRRLSTRDEPKSVLLLPNFASSSRLGYAVYAFAKGSVLYLVCDLLACNPPSVATIPMDLFDTSKATIYGRLIAGERLDVLWEIKTRGVLILHAWIFAGAMLDLTMVMLGLDAVLLRLSQPSSWKPLFGSASSAYTLRGFWGNFWHQSLRNLLSKPAEWVVEDIFGLKAIPAEQSRRRWLARYAKIVFSFALSGLLHALVDSAVGCDFWSGTMRFFIAQAIGILVEDHVQQWFAAMTALAGSSKPPWWSKMLGYMWVAAFQLWAQPGFVYGHALAVNNPSESPIVVSLLKMARPA